MITFSDKKNSDINTKSKKVLKNRGKNSEKKQINLPQNMPKPAWGNPFIYVFILIAGFLIFDAISSAQANKDERPISEVVSSIRAGSVQDIVVAGDVIEVLLTDGTKFVSKKEATVSFDDLLANNELSVELIKGKVEIEDRLTFERIITPLLLFGLPILLIFFIFKQMRSQSGEIFSFGKSRARLFSKGHQKTTFDDVAGIDDAKNELLEVVDFLKNPDKYRKVGARIPKGILLVGPAGVGKTLLAKAIAGEADVPFYSVAGSEFMEMLVGVGSARARDLFKTAKETQPSLIFIDEIDAIGRQRGMGIGGGHDEREQTLNQILIEMDGFDPRAAVIVLAATNRPDMLDPALVRPGRFDRRISISLPDLEDRKEIIKVHMKNKPFDEDVSVAKIAKMTVGFSGADLENMLNEAAILAARQDKVSISPKDIDNASLKVTLGPERKTLQTEDEKRVTAYHEAGHAIVSSYVEEMDPVNRISIIARGGSLGHTSYPPQRDRYNETKTRLLSMITSALGGRAAEEIVFNQETIGASSDIKRSTDIARSMVAEFGMSPLGPINYAGEEREHWVAKGIVDTSHLSNEMASAVDREVKAIIDSCYNRAKEILVTNRDKLDAVSLALLEKETLNQEEYAELIGLEIMHEADSELSTSSSNTINNSTEDYVDKDNASDKSKSKTKRTDSQD